MSQREADVHSIADAFVKARRAGAALADYPGAPPQGLAEAYAVQDAAIPLFGDTVSGWKVGRVNPPWLEQLGVSRISGPIFAQSVQPAANGHIPEGVTFKNGFGAAEAEFIYRIGQAPTPGQTRFSLEDAVDMVDAVFCGFEIASSPFAGINAMGPPVTISDFGNNNGLLLGPEIADWRNAGFEDWTVTTLVDGNPVGASKAAAFPGGLMESVRFLIENLVARSLPVVPGLLISSGAVTGVHEVKAGQSVEARFGDYCNLHCTIKNAAS